MRSASRSVLVMGWDLALQFIKKDEAIASRRMESEELIMLIDESKHFLSHELHEFTRIEFVNPHAMVRLRSPTETQRRNWIHNNVIPIIFSGRGVLHPPRTEKIISRRHRWIPHGISFLESRRDAATWGIFLHPLAKNILPLRGEAFGINCKRNANNFFR